MNNFVSEIKKFITIKTLLSIVSIGAVIPLCKALYWTFETSYFGYFGVSPEVFSRPLFSSGFISVWLFVTAMYPILLVWSGVMLVSFFVLVSFNYEEPRFAADNVNNKQTVDTAKPDPDSTNEKITFKVRLKAVLSHLADAIGKSIVIPFIFWASGFIALLAVMLLFIWADKEGRKLAKNQVDSYVSSLECKDGFNNRVIGCFKISGIDGDNHFVITNSKTHLIYLSRNPIPAEENQNTQEPEFPKVNIIEKSSNDTFKLQRTYKLRVSAPKPKNVE